MRPLELDLFPNQLQQYAFRLGIDGRYVPQIDDEFDAMKVGFGPYWCEWKTVGSAPIEKSFHRVANGQDGCTYGAVFEIKKENSGESSKLEGQHCNPSDVPSKESISAKHLYCEHFASC